MRNNKNRSLPFTDIYIKALNINKASSTTCKNEYKEMYEDDNLGKLLH